MFRADVEIDAPVLQAGLQRRVPALDQMQLDLRIARAERFERRRQQRDMRGERKPGDDASARAAVQLLDLIAGAPHLAEHRARPAHERLAHRREDHAARAPLEQRHAELALEFVNAARECGLGERQMPCRRAQTAALRNRHDIAHLAEFHAGTDSKTVSLG